jgi:hypothetical protein
MGSTSFIYAHGTCLQVTTFSNGHRIGSWVVGTSLINGHGTSVPKSQHYKNGARNGGR